MSLYLLHLGSDDAELHTETTLIERLGEMMYDGTMRPGYHVSVWEAIAPSPHCSTRDITYERQAQPWEAS